MFIREDGSYIPVPAAVDGNFNGLVNRDIPALDEAGFTISLRLTVSRPYRPRWYTRTDFLRSGPGIRPKTSR